MKMLMMALGACMVAGPIVAALVLNHRKPGFLERHGLAMLILTTVLATLGTCLFSQGAGGR